MRISDWSSDVCSSDLARHRSQSAPAPTPQPKRNANSSFFPPSVRAPRQEPPIIRIVDPPFRSRRARGVFAPSRIRTAYDCVNATASEAWASVNLYTISPFRNFHDKPYLSAPIRGYTDTQQGINEHRI